MFCVVFGGSCGDVCSESAGKEGDALRANTVGNWSESMTSPDISSAKLSVDFEILLDPTSPLQAVQDRRELDAVSGT